MRLQTALVTGASAGIGAEIVRQLVRDRGMTVLATARRGDRLDRLAAELPAGRVLTLAGDLADPAFREALWTRAQALPGGCDLLVNNAGLGHYAELATQDAHAIHQMLEINVTALIDLTQHALVHMKARGGGQILQVSSVLGFVGMPYSAVYTATKHAVNGLVKSVRCELKGTGVRVWAACPSRTESEFQAAALGLEGQALEQHRRFGRAEPTDRVVRGMLRGLDRRRMFVLPTWTAWSIVAAAACLPGPFQWAMERWSARAFENEKQGGP